LSGITSRERLQFDARCQTRVSEHTLPAEETAAVFENQEAAAQNGNVCADLAEFDARFQSAMKMPASSGIVILKKGSLKSIAGTI
jgi:hypothetical protein